MSNGFSLSKLSRLFKTANSGLSISIDGSGNPVTANYALAANAALTGVPTAPTAAIDTNTTQLATTAFVIAEIAHDLGYITQNSQSANYTTVLTDVGKHVYHPSADTSVRTITIADNATVPYMLGASISFVNDVSAGAMTIAIAGTDTLVFAGTGATGSRTIAASGVATALKVGTTRWMISGNGLT